MDAIIDTVYNQDLPKSKKLSLCKGVTPFKSIIKKLLVVAQVYSFICKLNIYFITILQVPKPLRVPWRVCMPVMPNEPQIAPNFHLMPAVHHGCQGLAPVS